MNDALYQLYKHTNMQSTFGVNTVALVNAKETASAETIVGDSAPLGSSQSDAPATE